MQTDDAIQKISEGISRMIGQERERRAAILRYVIDSPWFKEDIKSGRVTQEMLDSWGVMMDGGGDTFVFSLVEHTPFQII